MKKRQPVVTNSTVCVVMPAYNASKTIGNSLRSVLNQTYLDIIVVVVDDGSTDDTFSIVSGFSEKDGRVVIIHQENKGVVCARNAGVAYARDCGIPFLCFCDADDFLPRNSVEMLFRAINDTGSDLACGKTVLRWKKICLSKKNWLDRQSEATKLYSKKEIIDKLVVSLYGLNTFPVSLCAKLYRTSIVSSFLDDPPVVRFYGEDVSVSLKILLSCNSVCTIKDVVYYYQRGGESGKIKKELLEDYKKLYIFRKAIAKKNLLNKDCIVWMDIEMMNVLKTYLLSQYECGRAKGCGMDCFLPIVEASLEDSVIREAAEELAEGSLINNKISVLVNTRKKEEMANLIVKEYNENRSSIKHHIKSILQLFN